MAYKIKLSPHAVRQYKKLNPSLRAPMDEAIESLERQPIHGAKIKRLKGRLHDYYRYRVGDYRIVYTIDPTSQVIYIDYLDHRREIYRGL